MRDSCKKYLCVLILLLAFAVRLWDLNARSLWFDEAFEYWSAQVPLWSLPRTVTTALQPPLYTFVLHLWLKVSIEPLWLRFLSVGLGLLALSGTMALAYRVSGGTAAAAAGMLMALLPAEVRYAQEVAEYALMGCLLAWSLYCLYASIEAPTWRNLGLWGILSVLSVYSHYGAALTVFAAALVVVVREILGKRWKEILRRL